MVPVSSNMTRFAFKLLNGLCQCNMQTYKEYGDFDEEAKRKWIYFVVLKT